MTDNMTELMNRYDEQLKGLGENKSSLTYVSVDNIYPHKDNPRKDLGDLTELSDSIKANGIMQNLTLVPWALANPDASASERAEHSNDYTAVIGHRRHAASKLAGLKEVPCVISNMPYEQQLATMLMENMQRSDLTPYEQAKSFQMMMDLGESVGSLAEKTGFSQATVRRRLKMAELDEKTMQKVSSRQLSLADFAKLEEIEDISVRNSVLNDIGTKNFENRLQQALKKQTEEKNKETVLKEIERLGIKPLAEMKNPSARTFICTLYAENLKEMVEEKIKSGVQYYYENIWSDRFSIYKRGSESKTPEELEKERKQAEEARLRGQLDEASTRAHFLRYSFIKDFPKNEVKKHMDAIIAFTILDQWNPRNWHNYASNTFMEILGVKDRVGEKSYKMIADQVSKNYEYALLVHAYSLYDDSKRMNCHGYSREFTKNSTLEKLYDFLTSIGYEMSDEEQQLLDGTHPLYAAKTTEAK